MLRNLTDINNTIDRIYEEIKTFDSDERKEIKKNNKIIDTYVYELESVKEILFNQLKDRCDELIPSGNNSLEIDNNDVNMSFEKIKYLSVNSYIYKMNIDKNMYEIKYSNSLDIINNNIMDLINKFLVVNIVLTKEDFKYSLSLYKYMVCFFDNKDIESFNVKIKDTFDSLYWECPDLVNHIYLCFMLLLEKYKDKFESYIKYKYNDDTDYDSELENYYKLIVSNEEKMNTNESIIYNRFFNGELRIEDYLNDSINKKEIISKFISYDKYLDMNNDDRVYFYEQIKGIYYDLCEYLLISRYCYMINKIKEIYSNKSSYVNNYNTFIKSMKGLNKQRIALNNKLFVIYNKMINKNSDRLLKKYNNLFNKANNKINEIISGYDNYDEILFINDVITKLDDDNTYYDVFKIFESNYSYLSNLMKDNDGNYDEFIDFLYNSHLNISKSIPFISSIDIESKLNEKYDLFDIDINLFDKNKLKEDLEYIIRLGYFDVNNINLDKYKLIFDIKKITGE